MLKTLIVIMKPTMKHCVFALFSIICHNFVFLFLKSPLTFNDECPIFGQRTCNIETFHSFPLRFVPLLSTVISFYFMPENSMAKHNLTKDSLKIRNESKCRIAGELDLNSIVVLI